MFEIPTTAANAEAIRIAHEERARAFATIFSTYLNPVAWARALTTPRDVPLSNSALTGLTR